MSTLLRKLLASASIAAIVSTLMVSTALAASYTDVAEGDVWYDAVEQGVADGVFTVPSDGKYNPFEGVNRAMMAVITVKAAGLDLMDAPEAPAPDVPADHWAADAIYTGLQNGLWNGYADGNYGPGDLLTRAQASIIMQNAFGFEQPETCSPELSSDLADNHYGKDAMVTMYCWSVINGYENGNWGPNDTLTRYQVAIIVDNAKYNYEERVVGGEGEGEGEGETVSSGEVTITEGDNAPESMTVPTGATNVNFMEFTLTAGDEEADVEGLTFVRQGVGATSDFTNVYLYEGNKRLTSGRSVSSDDNTAEFSSLGWNLAPGESRTFQLRADIASGAVASNEHRFYIGAFEGATAGGEVNLAGPYIKIGGSAAGTVTIEKNGTLTNPSLGANGVKVAQFKVSASNEDVTVRWINVYVAGTISKNEISNFMLYKGTSISDDNLVAEAMEIGSQDTVDFDLGDGVEIEDGDEQIFIMTADLDGDSGDTVATYIDETTDVYAVGDVFGTGSTITIDTTYDGSTDSVVTLQGGEVTLSFNGPAATDVAVDTKKVTFLDFSLKADRDIEVKQLVVVVDDTTCDEDDDDENLVRGNGTEANFKNIRIMEGDKNMMETESFANLSTDASDCQQTLTFTDSFYVDQGETKDLSVKMDIDDGASAADTIQVTLNAISDSAGIKDVATNKFLSDIVPSSAIVGNTMTTVSSSLTISLASTPVSDEFVKGTKNVPVVGFLFKSGTADSVRVTGVTFTGYFDEEADTSAFDGTGSDGGVNLKDVVNNIRLYEDGYAADKTPAAGPEGVEDDGTVVFTNMTYDIPASTTKKLVVVGNVSTNAFVGAEGETFSFDLADVSADITAEDSDGDTVTATGDAVNGAASPTVFITTANTGTLTVSTKSSTTPSANIAVAGRTGVELARFEFSATTEDITVNDVTFGYAAGNGTTTSAGQDEVVSISVYDEDDLTTALATGFVNSGVVDIDDMGFVVPADDSAVMVVTADLNTLPKGADSGDAISVGIKAVDDAQGSAGSTVAVTELNNYNTDSSVDATVTVANTTTAALTMSAADTLLSVGDVILVGSEYMMILDKDANDDDATNDHTDGVSPDELDYTVARGVWGSTAAAHTAGTAITSYAKATGKYMVVRETKPTFTTVAYPAGTKLTNGNAIGIYKFTVDAEAEEDISIGRLVFKVSGQFDSTQLGSDPDGSFANDADNPAATNGTATNGTDGLSTSTDGGTPAVRVTAVTLYDVTDGETISGTTVSYQNQGSTATGYIVVDFGTEEEIGSTGKTYELRADISGVQDNGDFISVLINEDGANKTKIESVSLANAKDSTLSTSAAQEPVIEDDVVWSDQSSTAHTTSTSDWTNGYLLKSLKTVAQTLSFTTS